MSTILRIGRIPKRSPRGMICVFAKPPRPGDVKTRLVPELGKSAAAELARAFIADTWSQIATLEWADPVLATTEQSSLEVDMTSRGRIWLQSEGDLGARLERVLRRALRSSASAMAIGADTPGLPPRLLERARSALRKYDACLGPSEDGGFYLLGLTRCPRGLLEGLPWSQEDTFERTLARLRDSGLSTAVLPPWFDVDRLEDLHWLAQLVDAGEVIAPNTSRWLQKARRNARARRVQRP